MSNSAKDNFLADPKRYADKAYSSLRYGLVTIERIYAKGAPKFHNLFTSMVMAHEDLGLLAYFARHDMAAFKMHWALASRLSVHAARHVPDSAGYMTGGCMLTERTLLYTMVSESHAAISEAADFETYFLKKYRDDTAASEFSFHLAQLVIRGDYEAAQAKIEMGAKKARGKIKKAYETKTDFYSLLMKGDKAALEHSITDYFRTEKRNTMPIVCDFVYPVATFRTKLCWYKGIPVEIEHPMVPMEWMPIDPLPRYDDIYDFLSPDWVPPDQGFFARLSRKFQKEFPNVDACMKRIRAIDERS